MAQFELRAAAAGRLSANAQGALYMAAAALGFAVMNTIIRYLSADFEPLQIAFFRNVFALAFMLPWLSRVGVTGLRTQRLGTHLWRAAIGFLSMVCWFYAIALLPLAEAISLNFTVPLFVTIGAALVLGEVVRLRRWSATIVGFLGVLIIVRPGFAEVTWPMALPILAAALMAVAALIVKSLSATEPPAVVVVYMNLILTPLSLVPALFVWRWPDGWSLLLFLALGLVAAVAHIALTRSYARADASAVMPFDYLRLPFVAVLGFLLFGELPDLWTWLGAAVIAAAAIYIARREAQVARERPVAEAAREAAGHSTLGRD
ncbi:MAG: DMT family transporter [Kiloniellales bacterium]